MVVVVKTARDLVPATSLPNSSAKWCPRWPTWHACRTYATQAHSNSDTRTQPTSTGLAIRLERRSAHAITSVWQSGSHCAHDHRGFRNQKPVKNDHPPLIMPQYSKAIRAKVCEHLRGQLSRQQLADLVEGIAPHFHRGRSGDPAVKPAYAAFMNSMHGELDPEHFTQATFVDIAQRWIVRYSRLGEDACINIRLPRSHLTEGEWATSHWDGTTSRAA